jgi:hypothetical protein
MEILNRLTMFVVICMGITAHTIYSHVIITNDSNYKIEVAYFISRKGTKTQVLAPYAAIELMEYPDRLSVRRYGIGSSMVGYTNFDNQLRELGSEIWNIQRQPKYSQLIPVFHIVPTYLSWKLVLGWDDPNSINENSFIN